MAPVAGHPFLYYIIRYLESQGVKRFVFSLGFRHEVVEDFLQLTFPSLDYTCVIEQEPLKTGGAIKLALSAVESQHVFVINGDTLFKIGLRELEEVHLRHQAECTIALKPMMHFERYGAVTTSDDGRILAFEEKKYLDRGNINGGVYLLNKEKFLAHAWPDIFSFETDYLQQDSSAHAFFGVIQDRYFIDIGIPEDFAKAQIDLKYFPFDLHTPDASWTLFLDRDGVINVNKDDSYIFNRDEFIFKEGTLKAIAQLSRLFGRIIVITNQRGVGKGLMSEADLHDIHAYMKSNIEKAGGRIDDIFYCTSTDNAHPDRKPSPGMAFRAQEKYPEIDFSKSVMVGDKSADMGWGRNIGALTVLIRSERYKDMIDFSYVDIACDSLYAFSHLLQHNE